MCPKKLTFLLIFLFSLNQLSEGQNNTNSPYTRFGLGELVDAHSGEQKALGGVGFGSRNGLSVNTLNPASYSAVDSLTFMFDFGFGGLLSRFSLPAGTNSKFNANLEYITMQFPLTKWLGFSAGVLPFSFTGYNFYRNDSVLIPTSSGSVYSKYTETYNGEGGVSQVYAGLGAKFLNHISVGVNAYYMFGDVVNNRNVQFGETTYSNGNSTQENSIDISSFRFRYGLQMFNTFAKKHDVTLGLIYEAKAPLNGSFVQRHFAIPADTMVYDKGFDMPQTLGAGLYYTFDSRLSLGFDYSLQQWAKAKYFGVTDSLRNRTRLALGAEWIPDPRGRRYFDRVRYRAGLSLTDAYYKVNGVSAPQNFGISFGIGLPLRTSSTMVNASVEYGRSGERSLLREDYFKFTVNAVFNESWFFKRKL
jgi:hypothetical protein